MSLRAATALVIVFSHLTVIADLRSTGDDWERCDNEYKSKYLKTSRVNKKLGVHGRSFKDKFSSEFMDHSNRTISTFEEGLNGASEINSENRFSRSRHRGSRANSIDQRYSEPQNSYGEPNPSETVYYSLRDTFRRMNHQRRRAGEHDSVDQLYRASWREDNCRTFRRIVGGHKVTSREEMPFMAFIDSGCGGSIISDAWVLTAAHCVDEDTPSRVYVGSLALLGGCHHKVVDIFVHRKFSRTTLQNDIALVKVEPPFVFSAAIKPIALAGRSVRQRSCGMATGWGATMFEGKPNRELMMASIPIVSADKCKEYGGSKGQFCAGYTKGDIDTCQGDSGGPFVINGVQIGVVSYGYKCAIPDSPGIYVDVSFYKHWIERVVRENTMD